MKADTETVFAAHSGRAIRWIFLDRDGTLNIKPPHGAYVESPDALELLPGVGGAVRLLNSAGLWTGVVTNQRGVALGRMSARDLEAVHERLRQLLCVEGAHLDAIYACTHGLDECVCRKPKPGLLLRAQSENPALVFPQAAIVGDSATDMLVGKRLGLMTVLIDANGAEHAKACATADHVVVDLPHAASLLIARTREDAP